MPVSRAIRNFVKKEVLMQLLCSTGTFSRFPDFTQYQAILEYAPKLHVEGFELMFYPGWYTHLEEVARDIEVAKLPIPVIHSEKNIGVALGSSEPETRAQAVQWLTANCQLGSWIGTKVLVLHLWGWPELDDTIENNLQPLSQCLDIATQYGMELAIETIPARQRSPLSNVQKAIQRDERSQVALDTEFLALHHQLEEVFQTSWLWQEQRVRHVHIKDFDGQSFSVDGKRRYLHPGEGQIDFASFFARLKQCGFNGSISLEAPAIDQEGHVDIEKLQKSLDLVRGMMFSETENRGKQ